MKSRYHRKNYSLFLAATILIALLSITSCKKRSKKSHVSSTNVQETRRRIQESWDAGSLWIRTKYTSELHKEIIDQVFLQAYKFLNNPMEVKSARTQVFVLNSLPGTGKTQFVNDLAKALDIKDSEFFGDNRVFYRQLSKSDKYIDAAPFSLFAEEASNIHAESVIRPAIVMFDEYSHAAPLGGAAFAKNETELAESKARVTEVYNRLLSLTSTLNQKYSNWSYDEIDNTQEKREQLRAKINELNAVAAVHKTEIDKLQTSGNNLTNLERSRSIEETAAISNLHTLWTILGEGSYQTEVSDDEKESVQRDIIDLSTELNEAKTKIAERSSKIIELEGQLEIEKDKLMPLFKTEMAAQLKSAEEAYQKKVKEEETTYKTKYEERQKSYLEVIKELRLAASKQQQQSVLIADNVVIHSDDSPSPATQESLASLPEPPKYEFVAPPKPDAPVTETEEIWLNSKAKYSEIFNQIRTNRDKLVAFESDYVTQINNSTSLLRRYLSAYPKAIQTLRTQKDEKSVPYFDVFQVVKSDHFLQAGINPRTYKENLDIEQNIKDVYKEWDNSDPVNRLKAFFTHDPMAFFKINDNFISKQSSTKTFRTGHIFVFLASNVFYVQDEAEKVFANKNASFEICNSEDMKKKRGIWPRLTPDSRDPECLSRIVSDIASTPQALDAMDDALFSLFGSKLSAFRQNLPALRSRLGGSAHFIAPPRSSDYGNFVDFELNSVKENVRRAVSNYPEFTMPEIEFTQELRSKLYYDRIDAQAGYRVLQNSIASVVFESVKNHVVADILHRSVAARAEKSGSNLKQRKFTIPKRVVFGFDPATGEMFVTYDKAKAIKKTFNVRLKASEADTLLNSSRDDLANRIYAAWLAGEITLTSILFESLPGIDVSFMIDKTGIQSRAQNAMPDWILPAKTNWPAAADNILAHFAAAAAGMTIVGKDGMLPDTKLRMSSSETLIRDLHRKLRAESEAYPAPGLSPEEKASNYPTNVLAKLGNGEMLKNPVYSVLIKYSADRELSSTAVEEVKKNALNHMVTLAAKHSVLLNYMVGEFLSIVESRNNINSISPGSIYQAFIKCNDANASSEDVLSTDLLKHLNPQGTSARLGHYNSRAAAAFFNENFQVTTSPAVEAKAKQWQILNPGNIFRKTVASLADLSRKVAQDSNANQK